MGRCSYCFAFCSFDWGGECFSWSEAKGCFKISGPDDPKYIAAKHAYEQSRARVRLSEAKDLRKQARDLITKAKALESAGRAALAKDQP